MVQVWEAPAGDEIVVQFREDGPLIAVNEYGSDPLRDHEPPEGWDELVKPEGGR